MKAELSFKKTSAINIDHAETGRRIREARVKLRKSLRWMANQMDISAGFLSDLERGRRNWTQEKFNLALKLLKPHPSCESTVRKRSKP